MTKIQRQLPAVHEQPAERRAERGGDGADGAPGGDRAPPTVCGGKAASSSAESGRDHRRRRRRPARRGRRSACPADGRHGAPGADATANSGRRREVDAAAADPVGGAAEHHQQRRERKRVGVDDPRQRAEAGAVEVARDVRERDVDDRDVQIGEERAGRRRARTRPRLDRSAAVESEPVGGRAGQSWDMWGDFLREEEARTIVRISIKERTIVLLSPRALDDDDRERRREHVGADRLDGRRERGRRTRESILADRGPARLRRRPRRAHDRPARDRARHEQERPVRPLRVQGGAAARHDRGRPRDLHRRRSSLPPARPSPASRGWRR